MLLCSLQGKIVLDQRFKSICEVKTFLCLHSCTIKRVPALLQTAVSFHTPYSVNEKSSLLFCLSYCPGFASLRQVNSSNSQDKFQICCTDVYLVEFLANFAVFHVFLSISRDFVDIPEFRGSATARNFRSPACTTKNGPTCKTLCSVHNTVHVCITSDCKGLPQQLFKGYPDVALLK